MKYKDFDIEDFLRDEFFIKWVKNPNEETDHFWLKWIQFHPDKKSMVLTARAIIESIDYKERAELQDEDYTEIFEMIQSKSRFIDTSKKENNWLFFSKLIAVSFIGCCLMLGYFISQQIEETKPSTSLEFITKENSIGRKSQFKLPDGTKVFLNSDSRLEFPKEFDGNQRRVKLMGEAFFEVMKDKASPFIVEVGEDEIKVLGTSFNAQHRQDLTVALLTGSVEIEDTSGNTFNLSPNEMLVKEKDGKVSKRTFDPLQISGWKDNYLIFEDDPIEEVLSKLRRWYGLEIEFSGSVRDNWSYSGVYHKETLKNVLEGISITSNFTYSISGNKVYVYNNP
jgi:transmembrane sensor